MRRRLVLPLLALVGGFAAATVGSALGAFSGTTDNAGNSFEAAASFGGSCSSPGSQILTPEADTYMNEALPTSNFGTGANVYVRSWSSGDRRTLVRYALPSIPAGCELKVATLRLYSNAAVAGRTIEAYRASSSWTETVVTWNTQPARTGSAVTTTASAGWNEWTATSLVDAMYSGSNNGFLLQDATEGSATAQLQDYSSREGTKAPQLVVTFGEPSGVTCTDPGTVLSNADTYVSEASPTGNFGTATNIDIQSFTSANRRTLVNFSLPAIPANCVLSSALLRLNLSSGFSGRTLQAFRAASAWTETGATWNNQPATTGTATTVSPTVLGWQEWAVTTQVDGMYAGTNDGFLLRDAAESNATAVLQVFSSREGANDPELVLDFSPTPPPAPSAPSGLSATAVTDSRIDLSWTDNATNEDGFKIERSPGGAGTWEQVAVRAPNATSYSDTGLASNTAYDYRARAFNAGGSSSYSNVASATTALPPPPAAPSALLATAASGSRIDLSWTDNATNEDGFKVERSPGGAGTWTEIATVGAGVTTYANTTGLSATTTYDYRVRAYNAGGNSVFSNVASATTLICTTPGPQTVFSNADTYLYQATPTTNTGTETAVYIMSASGANVRSLVNFALPSTPAGCTVTAATLRLNASGAAVGRTLEVYRAAASWTETGATWNTQPATTGTAATTTSGTGWRTWDVKAHVDAMYAGTNNGFLLRDLTENAGTAQLQTFSSREGANDPELVLTFSEPAPAAPSGLSATAVSPSRIDLSWTDNSINEGGFKIERSPGGLGSWTEIGTVGAGVTSYSATGLSGTTAYDFRVRAYNSGGDSPYSNVASATTLTPPPPDAPSGLSATAVSGSRIDLSWTDNSTNEDGFKIERSPGGAGTWTEIATTAAGVTTYSNTTGLSATTTYDYRVRAYNTGGNSAYSNVASATTLFCTIPGDQTVMSNADAYLYEATPTTNNGTVANIYIQSLSGGDVRSLVNFALPSIPSGCSVTGASLRVNASGAATGRTLEAYRAAASWTETGATWSNQPATTGTAATTTSGTGWTTWDVKTHVDAMYAGTNDGFLLRDLTENAGASQLQIFSSREGANDPELVITFGEPPAAPSGLSATAVSHKRIDLSWTDNATTESGFKIERSPGGAGTWTEIDTVGANVTTYQSTGLTATTTYDYRVRASSVGASSSYSNVASATTQPLPPPPGAPSGLTATAVSSSRIDLSWTDNATDEDGFKIERSPGGAATWTEIGTVGAGVTTYQSTGLSATTTYDYRVRAYNDGGNSAFSNVASATTQTPPPPAAPTGLTATAISSSRIDLSWTDNATDEDGFKIERSPGGAGTWTEIATVGPNVTTYSNTGLTPSTTYDYRVRAYSVWGNSAFTNVASAKTQIGIDSISSATGTGSSVTWSHTVGAGSDRILVVGISKRKNDKTTTNITYGGVGGFTQVGSQIGSGSDHGVEIWYKLAPAVGTANIVVTLSGNVNTVIGAISFIGVNQTTPTGTFAGAGGTDASPTVNVSSAGGELVLGVLSISGDHGGITTGGGQTVGWSGSTGTGDANGYGAGDTEPGASSVTMSWSAAVANKWAVGGVSLKPA